MNIDKSVLIIFIDGFPYRFIKKTKYIKKFPVKVKVKPSIGYSINIKAEIFGGYSPDQLGWFCKWDYDPKSKFRWFAPFFYAFDVFKDIYLINRGLHRVLSKIFGDLGNIPFKYLPFISKNSVDIFSPFFFGDSLLKLDNLKVISSEIFKLNKPIEIDYKIFKQGLKYIQENPMRNILLTFIALDYIGHWKGPNSKEYYKYILRMDEYVEELKTQYLKINKNGLVIVLSDHGMSEVKKGVRLNLERLFGKPNKNKYFYIMDGTILRFWCFNFEICEKIKKYLNELHFGKVLSEEERIKYGITRRKFGDIIFLINEGYMFCPSFWGNKLSKGMHGYHPDFENQKGIFLFSQESFKFENKELTPKNLYTFLKKLLVDEKE